ncbi:hypothetical protein D9599_07755 [Roseomonas sp. KE2513]|nr:hypothetical protein [Roseomonas sp. KE2513]
MREVARHGMKKDSSITRLVRRTVGTDVMASELGAHLAGEIEARLTGIDHRLGEAMEARFEALAHRLEEAVQRTVGTEVHRNAAHLDGQLAARTEEGAQRLEGALRAGLAEEVHRNASHLDARVTELVHLRSEEVAGHLAGMLHTAVAEEVHRGTAHLDARVTELVHLRSEEVAGHLAGMLRTAVAEDVHQGMAYLDGQLAARGDAAAHRLEDALARAVAAEVHRNVNHLHEHLAGDLSRHLDERTGALHAQLIETLAADRAALMAALHDGMSHVDRHLSAHLSKEVALLLGTGGAGGEAGDPRVVQERLVTLGRLLEPRAAKGVAKRRVGHAADGGYVMLDDLEQVRFALSLGVGDEMTWDLEMAGRGIEVHQFDYTIEAPPETHERIRFHRSRIAPVAEGSDHSLASAQALGGNHPCIVKMDIEGDEWVVLDAAGEGDFERVTQLVLEFHDFDKVADNAWFGRAERVLRRLAASFAVVHVHANNYGALHSRGNVAFPELLEVTFANRGRYDFEPTAEIFPTPLDAPNRGDLPDIRLGSFRF